jgi:acyl carrier protein
MDAHALLTDIVRKPLPALDGATALNTIAGLDSLGMVSLVVKLECMLGRELTEDELERLVTVQDVENLLRVG